MWRLIAWLLYRIGVKTLVIFTLLSILMITLVVTIDDLVGRLDLWFMLLLMLVGLLASWGLATIKKIPGGLAAVVLLVVGAEVSILHIANLEMPLVILAGEILSSLPKLLTPLNAIPPDIPSLAGFATALESLGLRFVDWASSWLTGQPVFDPVVNATFWGLAIWGMAVWAGWFIGRSNKTFLAVLPAATLMAVIIAYHPREADRLLVVIGSITALLGISQYVALEKRWSTTGVDFAPYWSEALFTVLAITGGLLAFAAVMPSISVWQMVQRIVQRPAGQVQPYARSLGLEGSSGNQIFAKFRQGGLPRQHLLGSGPELSEQVVMTIDTGQVPRPPTAVPVDLPAVPRYTWRGFSYDRYTGRGWSTGPTAETTYQANESTGALFGQILTHTVKIALDQDDVLYTAGAIQTANQPYRILWRGPDDAFLASITGDTYQVTARVTNQISQASLRSTGSDYPATIRERFLHLPDEVPTRVLTLARDLTATAPTAYDRARAIENYLRRFPYSLDVPGPPATRDVVDYFLFDLQQGYCDYYASAMVVLARASGLPARLAVGYASGSFDPISAQYVVTAADAHSWPEIYFPEYGWIAFEPTAAQPLNERALDIPPQLAQNDVTPPSRQPAPEPQLAWWLMVVAAVVGGILMVAAGWWQLDLWRLRQLDPAALVVAVYQRLERHGYRLAVPFQPGDTPFEFAANFNASAAQLAGERAALLPVPTEVEELTRLYVQTAYSNHPPAGNEKRQTIDIWRNLRRRLWLLRLLKFFGRNQT